MTPLSFNVHPLEPARIIAPSSFRPPEEESPFLTGPPNTHLLAFACNPCPPSPQLLLPPPLLTPGCSTFCGISHWCVSKRHLHLSLQRLPTWALLAPVQDLSPSTAPPRTTTRLPQGLVHTGTAAAAGGKTLHPGSLRRQHSPASCRGHPSQSWGSMQGLCRGAVRWAGQWLL